MTLKADQDYTALIEQHAFLEKKIAGNTGRITQYQMGYLNVEERPYFRLKAKVAFIYMEMGMVDYALEHLLEIYKINTKQTHWGHVTKIP